MNLAAPSSTNRISIFYLMAVTCAIASAIALMQLVHHLRLPADAQIYGIAEHKLQLGELLIAMVYGTSVATAIFAFRTANFWNSPGKILAVIFSLLCLLSIALDLFSAAIVGHRYAQDAPIGLPDNRSFIYGIYYRNFAPSVGYIAGLPILAFIVFKAFKTDAQWKLVWCAYLLFAFLMTGLMHMNFRQLVPPDVGYWYFEIAIGIPVVLTLFALSTSMVKRKPIDWWTAITASISILAWGAIVAIKAVA